MSNVALAVEAMLREHIHDTFDEALGKTATTTPSLSLRRSLLLKWRSRVKKKQRGIKKERERERKVVEKKGTAQERVRERKRKRKYIKKPKHLATVGRQR